MSKVSHGRPRGVGGSVRFFDHIYIRLSAGLGFLYLINQSVGETEVFTAVGQSFSLSIIHSLMS